MTTQIAGKAWPGQAACGDSTCCVDRGLASSSATMVEVLPSETAVIASNQVKTYEVTVPDLAEVSPKQPQPFEWRSTGGKPARFPEELGFVVSRSVAQRGHEIGTKEAGITRSEGGEPDVFMSHSYSDHLYSVDMARFTCNCPSDDICCPHNYAAIVALPGYRHRAALLWSIQYQIETNQRKSRKLGPEGLREEIKKDLRHLPLNDIVDASIDAALGLWARLENLQQGLGPKQQESWPELLKEALSKCDSGGDAAMDLGPAASPGQQALMRMGQLLQSIDLPDQDLGPCLLALSRGALCQDADQPTTANCKAAKGRRTSKKKRRLLLEEDEEEEEKEEKESEWRVLAESVWDYIAAGTESAGTKRKVHIGQSDALRQAIDEVVAQAEVKDDLWNQSHELRRSKRVEPLLELEGSSSTARSTMPRSISPEGRFTRSISPEGAGLKYRVVIERAGKKLGMVVFHKRNEHFVRVRNVKEDGFMAEWNSENPTQTIGDGYHILEVNGERNPEKMRDIIGDTQRHTCSFLVRRPSFDLDDKATERADEVVSSDGIVVAVI